MAGWLMLGIFLQLAVGEDRKDQDFFSHFTYLASIYTHVSFHPLIPRYLSVHSQFHSISDLGLLRLDTNVQRAYTPDGNE